MEYYKTKVIVESKIVREAFFRVDRDDYIKVNRWSRFAFVSVGYTDYDNDVSSQIRKSRLTEVILMNMEQSTKGEFDNEIYKFLISVK